MPTAIEINNLSKLYRLGVVGSRTLKDDLQRWWWRVRGKGDPLLKIGEENRLDSRSGDNYVWALRDINLEVEQGEVLGIIGKNGAGKSTLLKILSRITSPTTGEVKIRGRLGSLLEVGTGFHPELTGRENIYLNGAILGMKRSEIDRKFDDIVDFAGVAKYIDTPVKRYSSGMYVRLGFAVAAFLEPDILVVDEVLAVGDAEFQKRAIGKMQDVSRSEGRTVLFVSHNMGSIRKLCDRVIILNKGKIIFDGNVNEGISKYAEINTTENLFKTTARQGTLDIEFYDIKFFDKNFNEIYDIVSGQDLIIEVFYKTNNPDAIDKRLKIGINFYDIFDNKKTAINNEAIGKELFVAKQGGSVKYYIPKFPLSNGIYKICLYSEVNGIISDWIRDVKLLTVHLGDYYGTGKVPASGSFIVYIDYKILN